MIPIQFFNLLSRPSYGEVNVLRIVGVHSGETRISVVGRLGNQVGAREAEQASTFSSHREEGLSGIFEPFAIEEVIAPSSRISQASELWDLERWLTQQRQCIDHTFDFRYSVLLRVFATLLRDGRLEESDLHGLEDSKIEAIRHMAAL